MKKLAIIFCMLFCVSAFAKDVDCGSGWWVTLRQNFGMEKTKIRFPHTPTVSQGSTQIMATAYDRATAYTFTGYYPPIGNIDAYALFDQMLSGVSAYPYSVLYHSIYENTSGNLVLEYTAQDGYRNYIVRSLTVVTPFNAYTLQCVHPLGAYERYTYFRDSFYIYCECGN